jgi:hypothetical protein
LNWVFNINELMWKKNGFVVAFSCTFVSSLSQTQIRVSKSLSRFEALSIMSKNNQQAHQTTRNHSFDSTNHHDGTAACVRAGGSGADPWTGSIIGFFCGSWCVLLAFRYVPPSKYARIEGNVVFIGVAVSPSQPLFGRGLFYEITGQLCMYCFCQVPHDMN